MTNQNSLWIALALALGASGLVATGCGDDGDGEMDAAVDSSDDATEADAEEGDADEGDTDTADADESDGDQSDTGEDASAEDAGGEDAETDAGDPDATDEDADPPPDMGMRPGVGFEEGGACEAIFARVDDLFEDAGTLGECEGPGGGVRIPRSLMNVNGLTIDNNGEDMQPCIAVRCDDDFAYIASNSLPHYDFVQTGRNLLEERSFLSRIPLTPDPIPGDAEAEDWADQRGCEDAYEQFLDDPGTATDNEPSGLCRLNRRTAQALAAGEGDERVVSQPIPCLGASALTISGAPMFGPNEAARPDPFGNPGYNYPNDASDEYGPGASLDFCGGHSGASMHYHAQMEACFELDAESRPLNSYAEATAGWDLNAIITGECDRPSRIVGWAPDGYPIRGGCVCTATDDEGACTDVRRARSGWSYQGLGLWGEDPREATALAMERMTCVEDTDCCPGGERDCTFQCAETVSGTPAGESEVGRRCVVVDYSWCTHRYVDRAEPAPEGEEIVFLDQCNGFDGPNGYAYYLTGSFPYQLGCYRGDATGTIALDAE